MAIDQASLAKLGCDNPITCQLLLFVSNVQTPVSIFPALATFVLFKNNLPISTFTVFWSMAEMGMFISCGAKLILETKKGYVG